MAFVVALRVKPPATRNWTTLWSYSLSLALHSVVAALLLSPLPIPGDGSARRHHPLDPPRPESLSKRRVIWLKKGERFPLLDSGDKRVLKLPHSRERSQQIAFTTPKRAADKKQFIFTELPKIEPQREIPSPNLVSLAAGPAAPPPPPKRELRQFQAPKERPRDPMKPLEFAESLPAAAMQAQSQIPVTPTAIALANPKLPRPPAKRFVLPSGGGPRQGAEKPSLIDTAPALEASLQPGLIGGGTATATLAILSPNPADAGPPQGPLGNRADAVQLGGVPGGSKSGGEGGGTGSTVPGLTIRGENGGNRPTMMAAAPKPMPASAVTPTRPTPLPPPVSTPTVSVPQWPNARRVPRAVEEVFLNRPVYVTVFRPPGGLPDWVLWFGETVPAAPGVRVFMRPPVPRQMGWETHPEPAAAGAERIWLKARLTKEGTLSSIVPGERTDQQAVAAISKSLEQWLFSPAVKNGVAIEADVLIEATLKRTQ